VNFSLLVCESLKLKKLRVPIGKLIRFSFAVLRRPLEGEENLSDKCSAPDVASALVENYGVGVRGCHQRSFSNAAG
jgi:hypothetical protein